MSTDTAKLIALGKRSYSLETRELAAALEAAEAQRDTLAAVLKRIEWCWEQTGDDEDEGVNICPACGREDVQGHDRSCDLAAALATVEPPKEKT